MGYSRGPIACGIDANPLLNYEKGIIKTSGSGIDHVISVVGWGTDATDGFFWIVRNSWGEYWGEMGYVRVATGALNLEEQCSWAVPKEFTAAEKSNQVHCHEGGDNCKASLRGGLRSNRTLKLARNALAGICFSSFVGFPCEQQPGKLSVAPNERAFVALGHVN